MASLTARARLAVSACAVLVALAGAGPAAGASRTLTFLHGPIAIDAHSVEQAVVLSVPSPEEDGFVVGLEADLVDAEGGAVADDRVMLHHVVLLKAGIRDYTCPDYPAERFYASGEERNVLALPAGYGYPNRAADRWAMVYMLMNHRARRDEVWVRYRVTYETESELTPVKAIWLDVRNCDLEAPSEFDVPGGGRRGSLFHASSDFTLPEGGLLVGGGGHLHGGGVALELADATCGTSLFTSRPTWAAPGTDEYAVRPILHEPGPIHMGSFHAVPGIPVSAGDALRLTAVYENSLPHTRAMGIMLLFLAPGEGAGCEPVPELSIFERDPGPPPRFLMALPRKPKGPLVRDPKRAVTVSDFHFAPERISIRRGTTLRWRFAGGLEHNVTVVSGPVGFSSPSTESGTFSHRFDRPGVYRIFCSLHPTRMTQEIVVRGPR